MFTGFSILIPTWNNLSFLKLCVESIRENSSLEHQIIVHINDGSDGTLEWVKAEGIDYTYTPQNVGVCLAMNMMRTKVATDYMYFVNDDMYVLPGWDTALMDEIKRLGHSRFFLSSTSSRKRCRCFVLRIKRAPDTDTRRRKHRYHNNLDYRSLYRCSCCRRFSFWRSDSRSRP